MVKVISTHPDSNISYRSEFCPPSHLHHLLHRSPLWPTVEEPLSKGAQFPLTRISNKSRLQDLEEAIVRGNHRSTKTSSEILKNLVIKDVSRDFQLPITIQSAHQMPLYGLVHQYTIDESGKRIDKYCMTHDQSFNFSSKSSVNNRVKKDKLLDLIYGGALRRILLHIHTLRYKLPHKRILIGKYDFVSAYRRLTFSGHSATSSCTVLNDIALAFLQLTFWGSPCPFLWRPMVDIIADLVNNI